MDIDHWLENRQPKQERHSSQIPVQVQWLWFGQARFWHGY